MTATGIRLGIRDRRAVTIGYPTVDLDTLFVHGAEELFRRRGVEVRYRAVADRIRVEDGAVTAVELADGTTIAADAVICAVPNSNLRGLLDDLPEHADIYAAADKLGVTPIVSTNLYLDRPLGTRSAMEAIIGGTGVIDEVFDRQRMHGRVPNGTWLYCLTTSGAYLGTAGLRPDQRTSVPNLMLAGDWTRTDWSATMESAVQSAARAVDELLKLPARPVL